MDEARRKQVLISRRTTLLASLGRAERFMERYQEERDKLEVELRLENLDVIRQGLEDVQTELEDMEDGNEGRVSNLQYRSNFETQFFKIKAFLRSKFPTPINVHENLPQNAATSTLKGLKLPTISLPEFSGDYTDWLAFHDTFLALIHTNPDVADIQKFHYLRAAIKGEAAQLIESIGISSANYTLAWEALVNRYANEYLLRKRHLQALLDCPEMKRESASALHAIVDDFERHVKILGQLGEPIEAWSSILEHILCTRLHDDTLKAWEDHASTLDAVTYKRLIEFLQRRMRVLESISVNQQHSSGSALTQPQSTFPKNSFPRKVSSHAAVETSPIKCYFCDQRHPLVKCFKFEELPISDKMSFLNSKRLCLNCFRTDHLVRNCLSKYSCKFCQKRHQSLIHAAYVDNSSQHSANDFPSGSSSKTSVQTYAAISDADSVLSASTLVESQEQVCSIPMQGSGRNVFMLTVILKIVDCYGEEHFARALLDCASQPNIISENLAQILRLKRSKVNVLIHGVGEKPQHARNSVRTQIRSRKEDFALDVDFLVLNKVIPNLPSRDVSIKDWNLPQDLFYADPNFHKSSGIDLIIGNEHFFSCFKTAARIQLSDCLPLLVDSVFGWIVSGSANTDRNFSDASTCSVTTVSLMSLEESLERFWEIEELPARAAYSLEEKKCEEFYVSTVARNEKGRYIVRLPRKSNFDELVGESKATALRRFELLERRLDRDAHLKEEYCKFMREYLALGHMRLVPDEEAGSSKECFLPHHPVLKQASTTTKVRVVFDASAKTSSGHSLNEALKAL